MGGNTPSSRPFGAMGERERELSDLCDPVALEARLKAARARRADALARRKAGLDVPAPRPAMHRGFAETPGPAFTASPAATPPDPRAGPAQPGAVPRGTAAPARRQARKAGWVALGGALVALVLASLVPETREPVSTDVVTASAGPGLLQRAEAPPPAVVEVAPALAVAPFAAATTGAAAGPPDPVETAAPAMPAEAEPPAEPGAPARAADISDVSDTAGATTARDAADGPVLAPMPRAVALRSEPDAAAPQAAIDAAAAAEPARVETASASPGLSPAPTVRREEVLVYVSTGAQGELLAGALGEAGFVTITTQPSRHAISASNVRYYHAADAEAAAAIAEALAPRLPDGAALVRDFTAAERRSAPGRIEVWVAGAPAAPAAPHQARATEADEIQRLVESVMSRPAVSNTLRAVDRGLRDFDRGVQRTATEIERTLRNATR